MQLILHLYWLSMYSIVMSTPCNSVVIWVTDRGFPSNSDATMLNEECSIDAGENEISGEVFAFKCFPSLTNLKQIIDPNLEIVNTRNERVFENSSSMFGAMKGIIYLADQTSLNRKTNTFVRTGVDNNGVCSLKNNCENWSSRNQSLNTNVAWLVGGVAGRQMFSGLKNILSCSVNLPIFCVALNRSPTRLPTLVPTLSRPPTPPTRPSRAPTSFPTKRPTLPTKVPTRRPSQRPTLFPTRRPTASKPPTKPTKQPTLKPTRKPTLFPTTKPTRLPTIKPTRRPTQPTRTPTTKPTRRPTFEPTRRPTRAPVPRMSQQDFFAPSSNSPTMIPSTRLPTTLKPTQVI